MGSFIIEGGQQLKGEITPQGAKNEVLQILCAVLLTPERVTINNIPDIIDVNKLIQLLRNFGVKVEQISSGSYVFQADEINLDYLSSDQYKIDGKGLRGSIMLVGPLLVVSCRRPLLFMVNCLPCLPRGWVANRNLLTSLHC